MLLAELFCTQGNELSTRTVLLKSNPISYNDLFSCFPSKKQFYLLYIFFMSPVGSINLTTSSAYSLAEAVNI